MIRFFRSVLATLVAIAEGIESLTQAVQTALGGMSDVTALGDRLASLEASQRRIEAEAEALVIKAESKFKAARAAEERTRHAQARSRVDEELEEDEEPGGVHPAYAGRGEAGGMPPMSNHVGAGSLSGKEIQRARKRGLI
jgi:hypothetical protein